ncbi:MAG: hypothetical protein IIB36_10760 [Gemmatimonadetes bacterium]|nr:hypothetical protein [Gemmatimonadota bacterium]
MAFDTTPEAARARWAVLAALDGGQRLGQALALSEFTLAMQREGARFRERAASERVVNTVDLEADHRGDR